MRKGLNFQGNTCTEGVHSYKVTTQVAKQEKILLQQLHIYGKFH